MKQLPRFRLMVPTEHGDALFEILGSVGLSVYLGSIWEVVAIESATDDTENALRSRFPDERYHRDEDTLIIVDPKLPKEIVSAVEQHEGNCGAVWLTLVDVEIEGEKAVKAIRDGIRSDSRLSGGGVELAPV